MAQAHHAGGRAHAARSPGMILVALGANLPSPTHGAPRATLEAALAMLPEYGVTVARRSSWYSNPAVPASSQPNYINAVADVATKLPPEALLEVLHRIEARLGRSRRKRWEARIVDLDLLDYEGRVRRPDAASPLELPHPRLRQRAFALVPIAEIAPDWRDPVTGAGVAELLAALDAAAVAAMHALPEA